MSWCWQNIRAAHLGLVSHDVTGSPEENEREFRDVATPSHNVNSLSRGVGESLAGQTLAEVLTSARAIHARLVPVENNAPPVDTLPGVKADREIKALADAIVAYSGKDEAQREHQDQASGTLEEIEASIDTLAALRRQIQLAADQAWPWRTPKAATIRKAFLLPTDRPLKE